MPFDAEFAPHPAALGLAAQSLAAQSVAAQSVAAQSLAECLIGPLGDPDPTWAERDPARLLAFLFVSPRPCDALDALIDQA
jgi:hypothetical protein